MIAGGYGSRTISIKKKYPFIGKIYKLIYPPHTIINTMPVPVLKQIKEILFANSQKKVLNIGCGSALGCGRRLWYDVDKSNVLNVDIESGPGVDMIADAHQLPFENDTYDTVIMQAVVEHLHSPNKAVAEALRILKKGGHLYLEIPFLQGFHADPHDYQRYTLMGLARLTENFEEIVLTGVSVGPFCSLIWIVRDLFSNLTPFKYFNYGVRFVLSWMMAPFRYLDYLVYSTKAAKRLACEYYILIRK
jgi:SAM-dependent methyltransferase